MIRLTTNFGTIDIELDYKNSKEKLIKSFNKKNPRKEILHGQTEAAAVSEIYHPCCFCDSSADVCNEFDRDGRSVLLQIYLSAGRSGGGDPAFHRKCRNPVCTGQAVFV